MQKKTWHRIEYNEEEAQAAGISNAEIIETRGGLSQHFIAKMQKEAQATISNAATTSKKGVLVQYDNAELDKENTELGKKMERLVSAATITPPWYSIATNIVVPMSIGTGSADPAF
jgi:hypothetical protein